VYIPQLTLTELALILKLLIRQSGTAAILWDYCFHKSKKRRFTVTAENFRSGYCRLLFLSHAFDLVHEAVYMAKPDQ